MRKLVLNPDGWPCKLGECPPGLFMYNDGVGLKTEYGQEPPYCADSGEIFWGGVTSEKERNDLVVVPVKYAWVEEE